MEEIIDETFLSDVYDANNIVKEIFKANFDELTKDFENSSITNIGKIMTVFCLRTEFINEAIYYLCKMGNIYSANIVFRSLIEHFLKQQYIFFRYTIEQNEEVYDEYYRYYGKYEDVYYLNVLKKNNEILESQDLNNDELKFLSDIVSEVKQNSEFKIMKECYKKFQYIEILKYIYGNLKKIGQKNIPLLKLIIPEYCRLSSFVHAGPQAELQFYNYMKKDKLIHSLESVAETSLYMRAGILSTTFLIGSSVNDKYLEISREIIKATELKNYKK